MIDVASRRLIAVLSEELLPGNDRQPSAVEVDIGGAPLDRLLMSRPDLRDNLVLILERFQNCELVTPGAFIETLSPHDQRLLLTVICGAYFLVAEVQQAIGYTGQQALTLDRGGFGAEELTMKQMELPKRYRDPTV